MPVDQCIIIEKVQLLGIYKKGLDKVSLKPKLTLNQGIRMCILKQKSKNFEISPSNSYFWGNFMRKNRLRAFPKIENASLTLIQGNKRSQSIPCIKLARVIFEEKNFSGRKNMKKSPNFRFFIHPVIIILTF